MASFPPTPPQGGFTCKADPSASDPGTTCATTGTVELALTCSSLVPGACNDIKTINFGTVDGTVISTTDFPGAITPGDGKTTADTSFISTVSGGTDKATVTCNCPVPPTWIASWQSV